MAISNPFSTKTAGVSTITAAEVNACGNSLTRAVDGTEGGTYLPSAPIEIGGDGVDILSGTSFRLQSGSTLDAALGTTVALAGTNVVSGTNTIQGTTTLAGTLTVPNTATLTGAVGSTITLAGTNSFTGATTASNFTMTGTNKVKLASRSITRTQASMPSPASATWTINAQGFAVQAANNTDKLIWPLRIPHGATLTSVSVTLDGAGHGTLPTMPSVQVGYISTLGFVSISSTTDPSGSTVSYDAFHSFGPTGLSAVIDRTNRRYLAIITGESGGNYVAGLTVYYVECVYTITEYDED